MLDANKMKKCFHHKGEIQWIGLRKPGGASVIDVNSAELLTDYGLVGDKAAQEQGGKRQVTLIQAEYLPVIASFLNRDLIPPREFRRNIVISGINLGILKGCSIKINDAVLIVTGNCAPCKKMEQVLGFGGFNAMRNHGGVTAVVERGGVIGIGDEVEVLIDRRLMTSTIAIET